MVISVMTYPTNQDRKNNTNGRLLREANTERELTQAVNSTGWSTIMGFRVEDKSVDYTTALRRVGAIIHSEPPAHYEYWNGGWDCI